MFNLSNAALVLRYKLFREQKKRTKVSIYLYTLVQHVLDSSASNLEEHRSTVLQVLQQIGVSQEKINNMIEVWNKVPTELAFFFSWHLAVDF